MSQREKLKTILEDGQVHRVPELIRRVYGLNRPTSARLAARIYDLKKINGYNIISSPVEGTGKKIWWYRLVPEKSHAWKARKTQEKVKS